MRRERQPGGRSKKHISRRKSPPELLGARKTPSCRRKERLMEVHMEEGTSVEKGVSFGPRGAGSIETIPTSTTGSMPRI